jgi:N,N-dimethylformamidase
MLDETGALAFLHGGTVVSTRVPLTAQRWYHVGAAVDLVASTVTLRQTPLADHSPSLEPPAAVTASLAARPAPPGALFIGAAHEAVEDGRRRTTWHFNGKIDGPSLARRALTPAELQAAATAPSTHVPTADALGLWDFAADISSDCVTDRSPNHLHGRTVNAPKRAVTGHSWDGTEMDWRRAPAQWGAIHFHDDDLYDAGWRPSLTTTIPAG